MNEYEDNVIRFGYLRIMDRKTIYSQINICNILERL
jgi:hypothetical protein